MPLNDAGSNDKQCQEQSGDNQNFAELFKPSLQRGRRIPGRFKHIGDFPHRRVHTRTDDDADSAPLVTSVPMKAIFFRSPSDTSDA